MGNTSSIRVDFLLLCRCRLIPECLPYICNDSSHQKWVIQWSLYNSLKLKIINHYKSFFFFFGVPVFLSVRFSWEGWDSPNGDLTCILAMSCTLLWFWDHCLNSGNFWKIGIKLGSSKIGKLFIWIIPLSPFHWIYVQIGLSWQMSGKLKETIAKSY